MKYIDHPRGSNDAVFISMALSDVKEYLQSGCHSYDIEIQQKVMLAILDYYEISSLQVVDVIERNPNYVEFGEKEFKDLQEMENSFIGESVFHQMAKVASIEQKITTLEMHIKYLGYRQS